MSKVRENGVYDEALLLHKNQKLFGIRIDGGNSSIFRIKRINLVEGLKYFLEKKHQKVWLFEKNVFILLLILVF